jgi:hypothetical protein
MMTSISPYSSPSATNQQRTGRFTINNLENQHFKNPEGEILNELFVTLQHLFPQEEKAASFLEHFMESQQDTLNLTGGSGQETQIEFGRIPRLGSMPFTNRSPEAGFTGTLSAFIEKVSSLPSFQAKQMNILVRSGRVTYPEKEAQSLIDALCTKTETLA